LLEKWVKPDKRVSYKVDSSDGWYTYNVETPRNLRQPVFTALEASVIRIMAPRKPNRSSPCTFGRNDDDGYGAPRAV